jgi:hypothetical protein
MNDMLTPQSLHVEPQRRDRVTAISGVTQRRSIVFVLGMDRSGASLCSHILSALGVDMADDAVPTVGNAGHWERREIAEFHDRILALFNRDYDGRFHDFALPVAWWADPRVVRIRREIVTFLEGRVGEGYLGFKDPRAVSLMPVWHQILNELRLAPRVVLCLRNPAQIAHELSVRDGLDPAIGEYRWLVHMIEFFRYANGLDFCTVEYDEWFDNPAANAEKLQKFLDLPCQQSESELGLILSGIIGSAAGPDGSGRREASQPLVRTLYKLAGRTGQDGARDQISYIVAQFVGFQQLQRPFLQAFEDVAQIAAKYPQIEHEAAALRAAVESAEHRADASEARLADAVATIEGQRAQIAKTARERDEHFKREAAFADLSRRADELLAALQAAQAELESREAALRFAEQEARQHSAAAEAKQAEVATLQETLAQAERAGEERTVAAAAMEAEAGALRAALARAEHAERARAATAEALQAEVIALWDTLAQAEHEAQDRASAAAALQTEVMTLRVGMARAKREQPAVAARVETEVAGLRDALARAEHEAQERAAAGAALQAEMVALQEALTAARQVGKTAIAALRIGNAPPPKPDGPRGWRQAIMRFFGGRGELPNGAS